MIPVAFLQTKATFILNATIMRSKLDVDNVQ